LLRIPTCYKKKGPVNLNLNIFPVTAKKGGLLNVRKLLMVMIKAILSKHPYEISFQSLKNITTININAKPCKIFKTLNPKCANSINF
jgi:hypothetical protein